MPTIQEIGAEIRALYGSHAVVSRKGSFFLVHLDRPSPQLVRQRTRDFDPNLYFCPDCPLCQTLKNGGIVIFNDDLFADSEET